MKLSSIFCAFSSLASAFEWTRVESRDVCTATDQELTDNYGTIAKSKFKKAAMAGGSSRKLKFMLPDKVRNEMDYTGFLIFWRKFCGADFLNALQDGRLQFDFLDHGNYYTPESGIYRFDGQQTNAVIQFRHAGEDSAGFSKLDKASGKRVDLVYFVIRGLDKVNWGNKNADTCLLSGYPTYIRDNKVGNLGSSVGDKYLGICAAYAKDIFLG